MNSIFSMAGLQLYDTEAVMAGQVFEERHVDDVWVSGVAG